MTAYHDLVVATAQAHGLSPLLLEAQVVKESSGQTDAFRYEPGIWLQLAHGTLKPKFPLGGAIPRRVASSYGLLQILYVTACDLGFDGEPETLFVPAIGLEWGARYLAELLAWAGGDYTKAFCAYNGGKGIALGKGPYVNHAYADSIMAISETLKVDT